MRSELTRLWAARETRKKDENYCHTGLVTLNKVEKKIGKPDNLLKKFPIPES